MTRMSILLLAGNRPEPDTPRKDGEYPDFLIESEGIPLVQSLIEKAAVLDPSKIICLFNSTDTSRYHLRNMVSQISARATVRPVHDATSGAACTALLACEEIENEAELLIMSSNEYYDASLEQIIEAFRRADADAGVITFKSIHPRYAFARLNHDNEVVEVAEKNPISPHAITGTFWFRCGSEFVKAAKNMIRKDAKANDAFFIAPSLNELILAGKRVVTYRIEQDHYHPLKSSAQIHAYEMGAVR